ncbi:MAG: hypothetical protein KDD62_04495, partial [Bdellovibrionales bacterium]|nr:hypothetical protein [Bdellovibrionales bacterium]
DFIVKPDALTRGAGVVIGKEVSSNEWIQVLAKCMDGQHVVQQFVDAPVKPSKFEWTGRNEQEFYGVDLFLLDGKFSGAVSRSHQSRVFNIGNGGKESVTLVVRDEDVA